MFHVEVGMNEVSLKGSSSFRNRVENENQISKVLYEGLGRHEGQHVY